MNLTIEEISVTDEGTPGAQDIVFALTGSSILYFRKGLLCPSDPGDTPADLMEKTVTHLTLA